MTDKKIHIMDGGMGRELARMGAPFRQPEWSALALIEGPEYVLQAHKNFIDAGAQIIIPSCYAVIPYHIGQERYDASGRELIALSAKLAQQAVKESGKDVKIAGCIPPIFGSYFPEKYDEKAAPAIYDAFVEEQAPYIDFWLGETLSSRREAVAITDALARHDNKLPLWLAYCLSEKDPRTLRSGVTLDEIIKLTHEETPAEALLYNCCAIEDIEDAIIYTRGALPADSKLMLGGYPNSFENKNQYKQSNQTISELRTEVTPEFFADYVEKWINAGADIVGGCCGISPAHIAALDTLKR